MISVKHASRQKVIIDVSSLFLKIPDGCFVDLVNLVENKRLVVIVF